MDDLIYWIWLTNISGVGIKTQHILLNSFGHPRNIYEAEIAVLLETGVGKNRCESIVNARGLERAIRINRECERLGIKTITREDTFYSDKHRSDDNLPILLYSKGNLSSEDYGRKHIGVIGARRCTQEDKNACIKLIENRGSVDNPIIVSGAAKGIDGYAHTAAIKNGLKTIAFVGNGLDIYYPREHMELFDMISQNGAVISQFPPGTPPLKYHFPMRNRLIAAWSDELQVFGAGRNSGTRYTVEYFDSINLSINNR